MYNTFHQVKMELSLLNKNYKKMQKVKWNRNQGQTQCFPHFQHFSINFFAIKLSIFCIDNVDSMVHIFLYKIKMYETNTMNLRCLSSCKKKTKPATPQKKPSHAAQYVDKYYLCWLLCRHHTNSKPTENVRRQDKSIICWVCFDDVSTELCDVISYKPSLFYCRVH